MNANFLQLTKTPQWPICTPMTPFSPFSSVMTCDRRGRVIVTFVSAAWEGLVALVLTFPLISGQGLIHFIELARSNGVLGMELLGNRNAF